MSITINPRAGDVHYSVSYPTLDHIPFRDRLADFVWGTTVAKQLVGTLIADRVLYGIRIDASNPTASDVRSCVLHNPKMWTTFALLDGVVAVDCERESVKLTYSGGATVDISTATPVRLAAELAAALTRP